jgi:hypothetical protein
MNERMKKAYEAAEMIDRATLDEQDRRLLEELDGEDIVVVRGQYDRIEDVLGIARIPHRVVSAGSLATVELHPRQLLIVNCPGHIGPQVGRVERFVAAGGSLVTTDWALKHVLEVGFPGYVAHNGVRTRDDVVPVEIRGDGEPFLRGLLHGETDPQWWLEGSSYPIRILAPGRVRVLLESAELGERYGERAVAVAFQHGQGDVLHMISHYYLQRSAGRSRRHEAGWKAYAAELGQEAAVAAASPAYDDLAVFEVEAAQKSLKFTKNIILEKQRRNREGM